MKISMFMEPHHPGNGPRGPMPWSACPRATRRNRAQVEYRKAERRIPTPTILRRSADTFRGWDHNRPPQNGVRQIARYSRQIAAGQKTAANGVVG